MEIEQTEAWRSRLLSSRAQLKALLERTHRIAVLGIKPDSMPYQPAHYVPRYMLQAGYDIIPVPVYYPEVTHILGRPVQRDLASLEDPIDLVNVFRRPQDLAPHLEALLRLRPKAVWLQSGIQDDDFAAALARAGIEVVQDTCLMVVHRSLLGG